jgi:uncharacterized membrane protein
MSQPASPIDTARIECWQRFTQAIERARKGDYGDCRALVESVDARFGRAAAQQQRRELWRFLKQWP